MADFDTRLLEWTTRLSGLSRDRILAAMRHVRSWKIAHLETVLACETVDGVIAAVLLSESVTRLSSSGVAEARLIRKLRNDKNIWPTYAELRGAGVLLEGFGPQAPFELEPHRKAGKHADFRLPVPGEAELVNVEFKAIGLSDSELAFRQRVAPALDRLLPPWGSLTLHCRLEQSVLRLSPEDLAHVHQGAMAAAHELGSFPPELAAVAVVGHRSEPDYTRRLILRLVQEVVAQLPAGETGWAAFHWTNGAPIRDVVSAIDWRDIPESLAGIIFVGDVVAFQSQNVHSFRIYLPRGVELDGSGSFLSTSEHGTGKLLLQVVEESSGVRAQLVALRQGKDVFVLSRRGGERRIEPFILLMDRDRDVPFGRTTAPLYVADESMIVGANSPLAADDVRLRDRRR